MVEGLASKLFRGNLQPVEIATRLVREADLAVVETAAGPSVPNIYRVRMSALDVSPDVVPLLRSELTTAVEETAAERGWRLEGPVDVAFQLEESAGQGTLTVDVASAAAALPPWAHLLGIGGKRTLAVCHGRSLIGRSREADVRINEREVSRLHALIWREAGQDWVADLGSANGTSMNGALLNSGSSIRDGDVLAFGPAAFTFRRR